MTTGIEPLPGASPPPRRHTPEPGPPGLLAHPVPPASGDFRWVYVWQAPLRAMHWLSAASVLLLVATGFWIGRPWFLPPVETTGSFTVQWMRLLHFVAAGILVCTAIVRLYWALAGNRYERLTALFPLRPRDLRNLVQQVRFYLFIHPERSPRYIGHNPLQQLSYTAVYVAAAIMIVTGFAMYGQANPQGLIRAATAWIPDVMGGMQNVRFVHHVVTWYFVIFPVMHVYLAVRSDIVEQSGAVSSILTGGKFVPADEEYADE